MPITRTFAYLYHELNAMPDETIITHFWLPFQEMRRGATVFDTIDALRQAPSLPILHTTALEAAIISEHSLAQNRSDKRDTDMHLAKQASQFFFGIISRIRIDAVTGVVHAVSA